ncbi:hypothetical protein ABVT39_005182 [Epinephelus coioides]
MEDVKAQMRGLTQELMREIKPLLQPAAVAPQPSRRSERERRQPTSYANDRDEQGWYEKLGKLYHIDETDVHGPRDLSLSLEEDGAVKVALVDATVNPGQRELPQEVSDLTNRPDLSENQQEELRALLLKWEKVFAKHDEDFGRTDVVQHQIHTGDAAPIRERYRPLPP